MTTPNDIDAALEVLDRELATPREIAADRVAKFKLDRKRGPAVTAATVAVIDPTYDFNHAPRELKEIVYGMTVRFSRRRLWSRLLR